MTKEIQNQFYVVFKKDTEINTMSDILRGYDFRTVGNDEFIQEQGDHFEELARTRHVLLHGQKIDDIISNLQDNYDSIERIYKPREPILF